MTPDIERLRASTETLSAILEDLDLELVDDPQWAEPSDTSYLSDEDRANPDIMANVEAMAATNGLIAWFGQDTEGFVGLWRGPNAEPLERAPVVRLDTEGQYDLVAATVADYLLISVDEDEFDEAREDLEAAGFHPSASPEAIWQATKGFIEPNDHRHSLYNEGRRTRGLPPVD